MPRPIRWLLLVFPPTFRQRFGDDMAELYADGTRAAGRHGRLASLHAQIRGAADLVTHGLALRREARRERRARSGRHTMLQSIRQDAGYAIRTLRKRPGFAAVALITLALGIGANTAIFSVIHAVLIRDLPYPQAGRIVRVYETHRGYNFSRGVMNPFAFTYWESRARSFEHISADISCSATLTGAGEPTRLRCASVTPSFFDVRGDRPALGRVFTPGDARADARVVVVSARLWRQRLAARPDVLDSMLELDDEAWRVVGVMPDHFEFPQDVDVWKPLALTETQRADMSAYFLGTLARLRPGVSIEAARAEMDELGSQLETAHPQRRENRGFFVSGLQEELAHRSADGLKLLQGVVAFVLLIACANVANLLLAQTGARRTEFSLRAAVGASRARLVRQSLTESVILALCGAGLGVLIAVWGVRALVAMAPAYLLPSPERIGVSWTVLWVTALVAASTGALFGLAPALQSSRAAVTRGAEHGGRTASAGLSLTRRQWLRTSLIAVEVAMAVVLLTGTGLLLRSFGHLMDQAPGIDTSHLLTAQLTLPDARYTTPELREQFWHEAVDRLDRLPGVVSAAGSTALPFTLWEWQTAFTIIGREDAANDGAGVRTVTPGLFETLRIPLLAGRAFTASDLAGSDGVVIVSEAFARIHLPEMNPVGQRIRLGRESEPVRTIVGVVGSVRRLGLDETPRADIYRPLAQDPDQASFHLAIRTDGDPARMGAALREAIGGLDDSLPVQELKSMDALIGGRVAEQRFYVTLLGLFAALAVGLAATGVYGVMSFVVSLGRREIGIRIALGASTRKLRNRIIAQGLTVVAAGAAAGLLVARLLSRLVESRLFEIAPTDAMTYAVASAALVAVAFIACWIPTRRAASVNPVEVLRD